MASTIGFPTSDKENEKRRALLPTDLNQTEKPELFFFEQGYGDVLGYTDEDYLAKGANIVPREETLSQDIICDPKIGDATYIGDLSKGQTIFGWVHAVQNRRLTDKLIERELTAIAWEDMYAAGRHVFWYNNELAGEAAVIHAYTQYGALPYGQKVALIGAGNAARGAFRSLALFGTQIVTYDLNSSPYLREEVNQYDAVINAVLWDPLREDHLLDREDLAHMKPRSLIIDVSCDEAGAIETSVPTTLENPTYEVDGVLHYVVDHTPTLLFRQASKSISEEVAPYLNLLSKGEDNPVLEDATIVKGGEILDTRINKRQHRN